jgi:hypothetical protein
MSFHITCMFCDDIRQEEGGKFSLMGVYGDEMSVYSQGSTMLGRLSILLTIQIENHKKPFQLDVFLYGPRENDKNKMSVQINPLKDIESKISTAHIPFPFQNIPLPEKRGDIRVVAVIEGKEYNVGKLTIINAVKASL